MSVSLLRRAVPEAVKEPARLALAGRLEARARALPGVRGAALVLHAVGPEEGDHALELDPPLAVARLEALAAYLRSRYRLVHAAELLPAAAGRAAGEPIPVALTFDDDLRSHLDLAAPALARAGAPATAFVCGAGRPFWWQALELATARGALRPDDLPEVSPLLVSAAAEGRPWALARLAKAVEDLDPEARAGVAARLERLAPVSPDGLLGEEGIRRLHGLGWEIGFHTRRHDVLTRLADDELEAALCDGRERLPAPPRTFAYPHGKAGPREAAAARAAGYEAAFTGAATVVGESSDPHLLGRLQPRDHSVGQVALQLARALADSEAG